MNTWMRSSDGTTPKASAIMARPLRVRMARPVRESSRLALAHSAASVTPQMR
jgi:hypothetical protein